jgi:hypothetical protein
MVVLWQIFGEISLYSRAGIESEIVELQENYTLQGELSYPFIESCVRYRVSISEAVCTKGDHFLSALIHVKQHFEQ